MEARVILLYGRGMLGFTCSKYSKDSTHPDFVSGLFPLADVMASLMHIIRSHHNDANYKLHYTCHVLYTIWPTKTDSSMERDPYCLLEQSQIMISTVLSN